MTTRTFGLCVFVCLIAVATACVATRTSSFGDFRAFYCAGAAARHGADPYLVEPLHTCEVSTMSPQGQQSFRDVAIPAPVPGYAIAVFTILSFMPFKAAAFFWTSLIVCSVAVSIVTLTRLTSLSPFAITFSLLFTVYGICVTLGQIVPIAIAGVCLCAFAVAKNAWALAALSAGVAMLEPHIALPLCASLALWVPRSRGMLVASLAALCVLSLALPLNTNAEYFTAVLPAHALSEFAYDEQYSLTVVLQALGASPRLAVLFGSVSYAVMLAVGLALARFLALRFKDDAFYVLVPSALAVIGGPFIHLTQISLAIPAALLIIKHERPKVGLAFASLILLVLPWPLAQAPVFALDAALLAFAVAWTIYRSNVVFAAGCSADVACVAVGLNHAYAAEVHATMERVNFSVLHINASLAQASWAKFLLLQYSSGDAVSWLKRLPTWTGLISLLMSSFLLPKVSIADAAPRAEARPDYPDP